MGHKSMMAQQRELDYFFDKKTPERKIIETRNDFRRVGGSEGAAVNGTLEGACDWIVRSTKGLAETITRLFRFMLQECIFRRKTPTNSD